MKAQTFFLLMLCYFSASGQVQIDTIESRCQTVIAVGGLNIRSKPNRESAILAKIPFGERVEYLSKQSFGSDTIFDYSDSWDLHLDYKRKVVGNWAKIRYKGKIGFILDTYLHYDISDKITQTKDNQYALLFPYIACYVNIYQPDQFNWYGMYRDAQGSYTLKKISIRYFSVPNDAFGGKDFGVSAENNIGLVFMLGTKDKLQIGAKDCVDLIGMKYGADKNFDEKDLQKYGIAKIQEYNSEVKYYIKEGNELQPLELSIQNDNKNPFTDIEFIGDIDGDGRLDYILSAYGDTGYTVLFLSSKRKGKNLVEPVAFFYHHYCC